MSRIVASMLVSLPSPGLSPGASECALLVHEHLVASRRMIQKSESLGCEATIDEVRALAGELNTPGWDGDKARPVSRHTMAAAERLVRSLPLGMSLPTIGAEPDGSLTLEWYKSPHRVVSVSVSPDGSLHYAALIGTSAQYGREPQLDSIPPVILRLAEDVERER